MNNISSLTYKIRISAEDTKHSWLPTNKVWPATFSHRWKTLPRKNRKTDGGGAQMLAWECGSLKVESKIKAKSRCRRVGVGNPWCERSKRTKRSKRAAE